MPVQVWDYREHVQNLVAVPEIRARFAQVKPGPPSQYHSHDLGGEIFLVLDGEITFDVDGETVTCTPGQAIYVPQHVKHRVYTQGDRVATYYLSVTPHVEPTHTHLDEQGQVSPPRYGGWRGAGDPGPRSTKSTEELADAVAAEAAELARRATETADRVRREAAALKSAAGDGEAAKRAADAIWAATYPTLSQVRALEATWNQLAPRTQPR